MKNEERRLPETVYITQKAHSMVRFNEATYFLNFLLVSITTLGRFLVEPPLFFIYELCASQEGVYTKQVKNFILKTAL